MKSKSKFVKGLAYITLLIIAIPWYWHDEDHVFLLGIPAWVLMALLVALITSVFTAWNFLKGEDKEE